MKISGILLGFLLLSVTLTFFQQDAYALNPTYTIIDLTGQPNTNDTPYDIVCTDDEYRLMTLDEQGGLVLIPKSGGSPIIRNDDTTKVSGENWKNFDLNPDNNAVVIQKEDKALVVLHDLDNANTWTNIPLVPQLTGATYSNYNDEPATITVTATGNTFQKRSDGHADVEFIDKTKNSATQKFYAGLTVDWDFPILENNAGFNDYSFVGIVELSDTGSFIARHSLPTTEVSGIAQDVDVTIINATGTFVFDSDILYISDEIDDKIFKFNTTSNSVVETISLSSGTDPKGLSTSPTKIYVAMNQDAGGNLKFMEIDKSNTNIQTVIDTGISNTSGGIYDVLYDSLSNSVYWTSESAQVGSYNPSLPTHANQPTSGNTSKNHNLCADTNGIYWAGKGSVVQGFIQRQTTVTENSDGGGDGNNKHKTRPTIGLSHDGTRQLVDFGFIYNVISPNTELFTKKITITDNHHTDFKMVDVNVGNENMFGTKIYADKKPKIVELLFGIQDVGKSHLAELGIELWLERELLHKLDNSEIGTELLVNDVRAVQKSNVIDKLTLYSTIQKVDCIEGDNLKQCYLVKIYTKFLEPLKDKVMAVKVIDWELRYIITHLNEGFNVFGNSLNPDKIMLIDGTKKYEGLIKVTQDGKYNKNWIAEDGRVFEKNNFNSFRLITDNSKYNNDPIVNVMTKNNDNFNLIVDYELKRAVSGQHGFNSTQIQKIDKGFIKYAEDEDGISHREKTLNLLDWYVDYKKKN